MQQLLGSVLGGLQVEQLLVLVDELGVHGGVEELVVGQDVLQERDVGLDVDRDGRFSLFHTGNTKKKKKKAANHAETACDPINAAA